RTDTFFIATANLDPAAGAARGADVSHKGGKPGFVRIDDAQTLTIPDFVGNSYFNTIGNLLCNPRAGLLFIDFESGDLLYVAATAEVLWDDPDAALLTGAQRLLRFHVRTVRRNAKALPIRWTPPEYARELERTGVWPAVAVES
ncbi:MAG: pyridoxamine 5'-phosphate oxidase, partial [Candidimonas sp.]